MSKVKPCPFCGDEPWILPEDPKTEGDAWTKVACVNHKCSAKPSVAVFSDDGHRRAAIRRWNKRVTTP